MAGTQVEPGFVEPDYAGRTLGDVLPAVAQALGVPGFQSSALVLPPAPAYVVMLVDGLGYDLLAEHRVQAPYLHSLLGQPPATCGVPSTTATSLTSLGTALTPGQHGLVGFTSRVPETGALLNSLFWDQPVDPLEWQPNPTAFARLEMAGVHTSVVSKREFRRLRADPVRPAGCGVRRCRRRRRTDRRSRRRGRAAAVADLRVRRRPRLARPPRRRRLAALARPAARHRRGRAGAARRAARRRPPPRGRRPRDGRLDQGDRTSTSTSTRRCATG